MVALVQETCKNRWTCQLMMENRRYWWWKPDFDIQTKLQELSSCADKDTF